MSTLVSIYYTTYSLYICDSVDLKSKAKRQCVLCLIFIDRPTAFLLGRTDQAVGAVTMQ